jgi:hypothetical protein
VEGGGGGGGGGRGGGPNRIFVFGSATPFGHSGGLCPVIIFVSVLCGGKGEQNGI